MKLDVALEHLITADKGLGEVFVVAGPSGSGKTNLLRDFIEHLGEKYGRLDTDNDEDDDAVKDQSRFWVPLTVLTADRQRAEALENSFSPKVIASVAAPGGHRPIRSINSFAYLVISQWLIERSNPAAVPPFTTGADEDLWIAAYLQAHSGFWSGFLDVPAEALVESDQIRKQFRDAFDRFGQYGLRASQVEVMGLEADQPVWVQLANAFEQYAGSGETAYTLESSHKDSARLPIIAANLLKRWDKDASDQGVSARCPVPKWLIVDGAEEFTPNLLPLIEAIQNLGGNVLVTADSTTSTGAYRGAVANLGEVIDRLFGAQTLVLEEQRHMTSDIADAYNIVSAWTGSKSELPVTVHPQSNHISLALSPNFTRQSRELADLLKLQHYGHAVPWQQMAVLVRASTDIEPLRRALKRADIPLAGNTRPIHFASVPICAMLLQLLSPQCDLDEHELALSLLLSPLIDLDKLALYQALRQEEGNSQETLLKWLSGEEPLPNNLEEEVYGALSKARNIWTLRASAQTESAQLGLWLLWDEADVGAKWQVEALEDSWAGDEADSRLDAVLALFRKADLWEQLQSVTTNDITAARFATEVLQEEISSDTIAQVGLRAGGVSVLTVAQAVGPGWDTVCIVGLQEGGWPTNSMNTGLTKVDFLTDLLEEALTQGWNPLESDHKKPTSYLDPGRLVQELRWSDMRVHRLQNEARLLAAAISKARNRLHFSVIENEEDRGSIFVDYLCKENVLPPFRDEDGNVLYTPPPPEFSLEALVGQLRATMSQTNRSMAVFTGAAKLIAFLASQKVLSADPTNWVGQEPQKDTEEIVSKGQKIRLSPSNLERAQTCLLQWFYSAIAVQDTAGILSDIEVGAAQIGSLVHDLAERYPKGPASELEKAFAKAWEDLDLDDSWWSTKQKQQTEEMVRLMAAYFVSIKGEVETEVKVKMDLPDAQIYGRIDRIEPGDKAGEVHIADLKTSKTKPSAKAVQENVQLQAYQMALLDQGLAVSGASLITIGAPGTRKDPDEVKRTQAPLTPEQVTELRETFNQLAVLMRGPTYLPTIGKHCPQCPYQKICPAMPLSIRETK